MSVLVVLMAARVHQNHQSHSEGEGGYHTCDERPNSMTAQAIETAKGKGSCQHQNCQGRDIENYSVERRAHALNHIADNRMRLLPRTGLLENH